MFDLLGNQEGASFFSAMSVASSPGGRESGHTGCFWSHLWGGIGAARSGQEGLSAFFKEMNWTFDLERHWSGRIVYQGNIGGKGKQGEAKTKWDCSGVRLLQLCLPRRHLFLTGKQMTVEKPLRGRKLEAALEAGRLIGHPEKLKTLTYDEILDMLMSNLAPTRYFAAQAIVAQDLHIVDGLLGLLESNNPNARYGACEALGVAGFGSTEAVAALLEEIRVTDDLNFRLSALDALTGRDLEKGLAQAAKPAIPALLKMAQQYSDDDPRRLLQRKLGFALFYLGRALPMRGLLPLHGVDDVDRSLLIPAIKELLTVDDGRSRSCVGWVYSKLTEQDLELLWGDIYRATRDLSPSGIMFADGIRHAGLKLMQERQVEEGVSLAASIIAEERWGRGKREKAILPILAAYGGAAKPVIPVIKAVGQKDRAQVNKTLDAVEKGSVPKLKSIAPYIERF